MKHAHLLRLAAILVSACLLCSLSAALATTMEIVPLEETDGYSKEYYLTDVGLTLKLPVNATVDAMLDNVDQKGLGIYLPDYPDAYFAFFAFYDSELEGKSLTPLDGGTVQTMLRLISNNADNLRYTTTEEVLPGVRMLRVPEPAYDFDSEHLLALRDGWVLNAMLVQLPETKTSLETLRAVQADMMRKAYADEGFFHRVQTIALPESAIALTVPDSMNLRLATEEDGFYEIYVVPNAPGYQLVALHVLAVKQPDYTGQTVTTLGEPALEAAMILPTYAKAYDENSVAVLDDFEGGRPVIAYESDATNKHLLALRDGWALYASVFPIDESIDPAWIASLQQQVMHALLGGAQPVADWVPGMKTVQVGNVLRLPLLNKVLELTIPDGYGVDIWQDNADSRDIYLYALDDSPRYFEITAAPAGLITGDRTIADMYTDLGMLDLCKGVSDTIGELGVTAESAFVREGFGGVPSIHSTTREQLYEQYYGLIDSHFVSVSFTSEDAEITEAESEALKNLIQQP